MENQRGSEDHPGASSHQEEFQPIAFKRTNTSIEKPESSPTVELYNCCLMFPDSEDFPNQHVSQLSRPFSDVHLPLAVLEATLKGLAGVEY